MNLESIIGIEVIEDMLSLARETPAGCFIEVGVYKGGSAQFLYELAMEQDRSLYLFDTFTGIPIKSDIDTHEIGDFGDTDLDLILRELPQARVYIGEFPSSLPGNMITDVAFVHVDCDQYESIKACITHLYPVMVKDGIMLFDDFDCLEGAKKAVLDYFDPNELKFTRNGKAYIHAERM